MRDISGLVCVSVRKLQVSVRERQLQLLRISMQLKRDQTLCNMEEHQPIEGSRVVNQKTHLKNMHYEKRVPGKVEPLGVIF